MNLAIETRSLTKKYGATTVLDDVTLGIQKNTICGLLGRNGAGKTTLMSILAGQELKSSGEARVLGGEPFENAAVLASLSFARENQKYPEDFKVTHVLRAAPWFYAGWDADFARRLVGEFRLPLKTPVKKLSRGQLSAVAIVVGLASRAPVTFFDEPYLGLDATARGIFYDLLLEDYMEYPRTILMSTHLIDEAANLLEHVVVLQDGRKVLDSSVEEATGSAFTLSGTATAVETVGRGRQILRTQALGGLRSVTVAGAPDEVLRTEAHAAGLEVGPVSLQELVAAYGLLESGESSLAATRTHQQAQHEAEEAIR
ncbi:ATP-binding cassette domain-containing protein [Arthrobacter sp. JSM 101049]|uniref:ATP-binding cassette domain-containing protein n=1 Tax=Arthrobacter sp. JSM 101049 TaxID=929097 RepID=UPI003562903C